MRPPTSIHLLTRHDLTRVVAVEYEPTTTHPDPWRVTSRLYRWWPPHSDTPGFEPMGETNAEGENTPYASNPDRPDGRTRWATRAEAEKVAATYIDGFVTQLGWKLDMDTTGATLESVAATIHALPLATRLEIEMFPALDGEPKRWLVRLYRLDTGTPFGAATTSPQIAVAAALAYSGALRSLAGYRS